MSLGKVFGKILRPRVLILFTIFDTNIYRGISEQRLKQMRLLEQQQGVVALSAYWPALELLAGFNGRDSAEAARCEKAIARLVDHAAYPHEGSLRIGAEAERLNETSEAQAREYGDGSDEYEAEVAKYYAVERERLLLHMLHAASRQFVQGGRGAS